MMNKLLTAIQVGRSMSMDNVVSSLPKVFPKRKKNNAKTNDPKRKRTNKNGPKRNERGEKRKMNNRYKNRESCQNILTIKI